MRKKSKEKLESRENNAVNIAQAAQDALEKLLKNSQKHQRYISAHSNKFEILDKNGNVAQVHLIVLGDLHCRNKEDYLFIGLVPEKRLRSSVSKLRSGAQKQKHLCIAWKEFFLIRDKKQPTQMRSKSRIRVQEKKHQNVGIGTSLFLSSEKIRDTVIQRLSSKLRVQRITAEIFDENGAADWTSRVVEQHLPYYTPQRERGLYEYRFQV